MKNKNFTYYFELAARLHVFFLINIYGWGKILGGQFYKRGHLPEDVAKQTLAEANGFDLAWTFMGHSYAYILFIGIFQIIGAWLLLWDKTKLIGVAILVPILLNIVVFDIIFLDFYGALASASIYLILLLVIAFINKKQIIEAFRAVIIKHENKPSLIDKIKTYGVVLVLVVLIFGIEQVIVNILGH